MIDMIYVGILYDWKYINPIKWKYINPTIIAVNHMIKHYNLCKTPSIATIPLTNLNWYVYFNIEAFVVAL